MGTVSSVCVYCGSANDVDARHLDGAALVGAEIARRGFRMVYGGGNVGSMGAAARAAYAGGAEVLGILPRFLQGREPPSVDIPTRLVDTMHERKRIMFEESDGFIVLPGGIGTLEEVVEMMSWRRLELHDKPVVFFDSAFWRPMIGIFDAMTRAGFLPNWFHETYAVRDDPSGAIDSLLEIAGRRPATGPVGTLNLT
jgi:uncharacterized protein (TIGR00730 family)